MHDVAPRVIRKKDPSKIEIEWLDGSTTTYSAAELRRLCPCANCVNELTGARMLDPAAIADDLEQRDVQLVGNYAITVQFADGHSTGIFPFPFLHEHDPAG